MLNTIDLFAGCGGLTEGFKISGKFNLLAAVEWEEKPVVTLRKRLRDHWGYSDSDAKNRVVHFDIQRTKELLNGFDDKRYGISTGLDALVGGKDVDIIIGGPPCQAYSVAGRIRDQNKMQNDYRNFLFESYLEVVKHFKPNICVFENVPGILSSAPGGKLIIERISEAFNSAGYYVSNNLKNDALFDLSEFGVPQKRKRVIIIAVRKSKFSDPMEIVSQCYSALNSFKTEKILTVEDALSSLPKIYALPSPEKGRSHYINSDNINTDTSDHNPRFHNQRDIEIFKLLAEDIESNTNKYTSTEALKLLYTEKTGKTSSVHKYHVLRRQLPSNTIPAHLNKDGLRHIHPDSEQARSITVREAARLQSFPDDFDFQGANGDKYKMIGNAVPPVFSKKIALALSCIIDQQRTIGKSKLL